MRHVLASIGVAMVFFATGQAHAGDSSLEPRKWQAGKDSYEALLVRYDSRTKVARLRKADGDEVDVPVARLGAEDRKYLMHNKVPAARKSQATKNKEIVNQTGTAWHTTPAGAAEAAQAGSDRPILWFRHVGELTGSMCSASHRTRVVSFADPSVQKELAGRFVPLSTNMEGMAGAGQSVGHLPKDAPGMCAPRFAHQNCQVFFLTPRLEIFHAATGFLSAEDLIKEMKFAENLFSTLQQRPSEARQTVVDTHRNYLKQQGFSEQEIAPPAGGFEKMMLASGFGFPVVSGATSPGDLFAGMARSRVLRDNQYLMEQPLISLHDFERDPSALVGQARFVFQSGPASGRPTGK